MAMTNPKGRANYEPNSWGEEGGPREDPVKGYKSHATQLNGTEIRERSETFADHYSQAALFYNSQTDMEKKHIANALIFELGKVEKLEIRHHLVSHLLNVNQELADFVARGLGFEEMPDAITPAKQPIDLKASPKLSIILNCGASFKGRKIGVFMTDGADINLYNALVMAANGAGVKVEVVAPTTGYIKSGEKGEVKVNHAMEGGSSVLFDAIALLPGEEQIKELLDKQALKDFVSDAYHHNKFIAYADSAKSIFDALGLTKKMDAGFIPLSDKSGAQKFLEDCKKLRFWPRAA